ncbi:Ig-like domain-containing protein [Myxococcus landrumensis]|uniref:Bacterial Ig-like domain-containing protein n=1 Tax=Myxococcus landrumensis TaxID=2813577 RepID=A0ABX7NCE7_9BACT|nr:Ig-like domain-containing protein [Myxococcus landrumus]QSQ16466.1 hypothetical protein JY572_10635 [Myxococcus landrumus]
MRTLGWIRVLTCAVALGALPAFAEADVFGLGAGRDEALTVQGNESRVINSYAAVTAPLNKGDREVRLDTLQGFNDGDLVMVLQMRDVGPVPASSFMAFTLPSFDESPVGKWEMARVESALGRTLKLTRPLRNDFAAPYTQVIRVPEFKRVTVHPMGEIKARSWDGSTGGVVAFLVDGTLHNNGVINASGAGFQQGWASDPEVSFSGCTDTGGTCEPISRDVLLRRLPMGGGGAIFFRAHALTGAGRIEAKGLSGAGAPGGGSISARLVERAECEVLSVQGAPSGSPWLSGAQGAIGGGTVLLQAGALEGCPVQEQEAKARATGESSGDVGVHVLMNHSLSFPGEPVVTTPKDGARLKGPTPRVTGFGDPGATVILSLADAERPSLSEKELPSTQVDESGAFSLVVPTPLADGTYQITAYSEHEGLASESSTPIYFTVDSLLAPQRPQILKPDEGRHYNILKPTISGTAEDAIKVVVRHFDGGVVGEAPVLDGGWSLEPDSDLTEGEIKVVAVGIDETEDAGPESDVRSFTVDVTPPGSPEFQSPDAGSFVNTRKPRIAGTAEAHHHVTLTFDGGTLGSVPVTATGTWEVSPPLFDLPDGSVTVLAVASDDAGNSSDASSHTFEVDVTPPEIPHIDSPEAGTYVPTLAPPYSGTAERNTEVRLRHLGNLIGFAMADDAGAWSISDAGSLPDGGDITVTVTATDRAGNSSDAGEHKFKVDIDPPGAPAIVSPSDKAFLKVPPVSISGTADGDTTQVIVHLDGVSLDPVPVHPINRTWDAGVRSSLGEKQYQVKAVAMDFAGNRSVETEQTFTVDWSAPASPQFDTPVAGTYVTTTTPRLSGTAEARTSISLTFDGGSIGTASADDGGSWELTAPNPPFPQGVITVLARATDEAGNSSDAGSHSFTVDTVAPNPPVFQTPAAGAYVTTTTPSISGTAERNTEVRLSLAGVGIGTTMADDAGTWAIADSGILPQGPVTVYATATDKAGLTGDAGTRVFNVDSLPPDHLTFSAPDAGAYVRSVTPTLSGSTEQGSTVLLYRKNGGSDIALGQAIAGSDGKWSFPVPVGQSFPQGPVTVSATAADTRGNTTPRVDHSFIVDNVPPGVPSIDNPRGYLLNTKKPEFSGTADPDTTLTFQIGSFPAVNVPVAADRQWSYTPQDPLSDNVYSVTAFVTDKAGNPGGVSPATYKIDTTKPQPPQITSPVSGTRVGPAGITIAGTTDGPHSMKLYFTPVGGPAEEKNIPDAASQLGTWTVSLTKADLRHGEFAVTAVATDEAKNTSDPSAPISLSVDLEPPTTLIIDRPTENQALNSKFPEFRGRSNPGALVTVVVNGFAETPVTTKPDGSWSVSSSKELLPGTPPTKHSVQVKAADDLGNVTPLSPAVTFMVDISTPTTVVDSPKPKHTFTQGAVEIEGHTEANSTLYLSLGTDVLPSIKVTGEGKWTFKPASPLPDGAYTLTLHAEDGAGNIENTSTFEFSVDSTAPAPPVLKLPADNTRTNTPNPITFSGTFTPPCDLTVFIDKDSYSKGITVVNNQWTFSSPSNLAEGPHEITATCTDKAGWVSEPSNMHTLIVDRSSPGVPGFSSPAPGSSVGPNTPDFGTITGTTEALATVTVLHNGNSTGKDITANSEGVWSLKVALTSQKDGPQRFEARARDVAGNTGIFSLPHIFTLDTQEPVTVVEGLPTGISTLSTVTFTMTASGEEQDVGFECTHNDGPPVKCTSPYSLRGLTEGPQRLSVKATDKALNVEKEPRTYTWEFKRPKTVEGGGVGCSSTAGAIPGALLWLAWAGWLRVRRRQS